MVKPTHYLWSSDYDSLKELEETKEIYTRLGFRVVTFLDGNKEKDLNEGMKELIKNHLSR